MNDLKIGKKSLIGIVSLLSLFTFAKFVTVVDTESAGGIVIAKETLIPGSVIVRIDDKNPADLYGGTWTLIRGDANLGFGDGSKLSGAIEGINDPLVPLVKHRHVGTMASAGSHSHTFSRARGDENYNSGGSNSWWGSNSVTVTTSSSGAHSHTLDIDESGVANATLDVRGARIKLNFWKRIQ